MLIYQAMIFTSKNFTLRTQPLSHSTWMTACYSWLYKWALPVHEIFNYNFCLIPGLKLWFKIIKGELSLNSYQNRAMSKYLCKISFTFLIDLVVPCCHCPSLPNNNIRWLLRAIPKHSGIKLIKRANAFLFVKFYLAWSV